MYRVVFLILFALLLAKCTNNSTSGRYFVYSDNLEALQEDEDKITGKNNKFRVGSIKQVNNDTVRSGKNSLRLSKKSPYGLNYKLSDVRTDEYVEISVWCKGPGQVVLVASHKDAEYYYKKSTSNNPVGDEWQLVKLSVSITPDMNKEDLNVYVWNPSAEPVFVDDFKLSYSKFRRYPTFRAEESMHLLIDTFDMVRLEQKRQEAFDDGMLVTEDDDYVSGLMYYKDTILPVELRLKGDWLDHLEGRKWSFRIKVRKQKFWNGMRTFSIHTPSARDFLNEYVGHEIAMEADLLSPRYGFVPVTLNGTSLGVYAWEEHFEKQMIESSNRREGPILKYDERLFWQRLNVFIRDSQFFDLPFMEAADILPFKINRTLKDPGLKKQFILGSNLMHQYRLGLRSASEIFDVKKLAGYTAMMDLTRGFHGEAWHNQRLYYNPILCRLEPIFFDAYTLDGATLEGRSAISGMFNLAPNTVQRTEQLFWIKLFQDQLFLQEYIRYLEEYSDPLWVNNFMQKSEGKISEYEKMLKEEFESYRYDWDFLLQNSKEIRELLPQYKKRVSSNPGYASFDPVKNSHEGFSKGFHKAFPSFYVNAYLQDSTANEYHIQVDNFYTRGIELIGYGLTSQSMSGNLGEAISLDPFIKINPDTHLLSIPRGNKYLFFKTSGYDDVFATNVMDYPAAVDFNPEQELFSNHDIPDLPFIEVDGKRILFKSGKHTVNGSVTIQPGYQVVFEPGCEIDFRDSSFLISKSPLSMIGTEEEPIRIISSDKSAMGFTTLQAEELSNLEYVEFNGFNTLDYKGWTLTGAVNFYESDVEIREVIFADNVCEDALNIIRSDFKVINSSFSNIFGDAFDSDFCTGLVDEVTFINIGNDAIDFSGSVVDIEDCVINKAGDKGVSAGEGSTLNVYRTKINGANIAYASKDKSLLSLDNCEANQVNYGLLAFQKKPEYGPGQIKTSGFNAEGTKTLFLIERFSKLTLNGTIIQGEGDKLAELFY